jgi:glycosyltransferase involved in cell wall biosynthesis
LDTSDVTAVIPNYRTLDLTRICVASLLRFYPALAVLLIDNGSDDESTAFVRKTAESHDNIVGVLNKVNAGHGPALHQGMGMAGTPCVFTFDSDCEMIEGGLIELMLEHFDAPDIYAIGDLQWVNELGVNVEPGAGLPYVHPAAALWDTRKYFMLAPFNHHGAPCVLNMRSAVGVGFRLVDFGIERIKQYVRHDWCGTRNVVGGIPGWFPPQESLPEQSKSAEEMLRDADPEVVA